MRIALALAVVVTTAAARAEPTTPTLATLVPAADARQSLVVGPHGEVYEPDGRGAWVRRHANAIAGDIAAATRGASALALTSDGALFRLADHAWTAVGLAPRAKLILGVGARPIAASGRTLFALDRAEPSKLPEAPGLVAAVAASAAGAMIATDRGLLRLEGGTWKPIKAAPAHVVALLSEQFALIDHGVVDLATGKTIAWPTGLQVLHAIASGGGVVAIASRGSALELVTVHAGKLASEPVSLDPAGEIVALAADRAGRVVLAVRDGRVAVRDHGAWVAVQVRDELPPPHPGPPPALSK